MKIRPSATESWPFRAAYPHGRFPYSRRHTRRWTRSFAKASDRISRWAKDRNLGTIAVAVRRGACKTQPARMPLDGNTQTKEGLEQNRSRNRIKREHTISSKELTIRIGYYLSNSHGQ